MKASAETERFEKKRQDVIDAASVLINEQGVKGMTFADVAAEVGLNATSITYYFGRKEKLVVAVYEATLDRLEAMAAEAGAQPDPRSRVRHFLHANIELRKRIRRGERGLITVLAEMRTLDEDAQKPLLTPSSAHRSTGVLNVHRSVQHSPPEHAAPAASLHSDVQHAEASSHSSPAPTTPSPHTGIGTHTPERQLPASPALAKWASHLVPSGSLLSVSTH